LISSRRPAKSNATHSIYGLLSYKSGRFDARSTGEPLKKFYLPIFVALFVLAIACGGVGCGGGGGSSTTTTSTTSTTSGALNPIRAEAALASDLSQVIDPTNIQAGESIQFEVAGYDPITHARQVLSSGAWTTSDNGHVSGNLTADGLLSASAPSGSSTFTATGVAGGNSYPVGYKVKPVQALVTGRLVDTNGAAASQVTVIFYNAVGVEVGRVKSVYNGNFRASVPTTAKMFNLDPTTLPKQFYYKSYSFNGLRYTPLEATCTATLPALANATTTSIGTITIDASNTNGEPNPPPPPPDGCPV
jgi:hypothetical protein